MELANPFDARYEIFQYVEFDDMENPIVMTAYVGEDTHHVVLGESIDQILSWYWRQLGAI